MKRTDDSICSLNEVQPNERVVMVGMRGGKGLIGRLTALGFTPGVELTMVQNYHHGPLIVSVRDTRVALGRGEASHILVRRNNA
ncbi:MAG: FeoA family protein [Anaerolineales bacterium]